MAVCYHDSACHDKIELLTTLQLARFSGAMTCRRQNLVIGFLVLWRILALFRSPPSHRLVDGNNDCSRVTALTQVSVP